MVARRAARLRPLARALSESVLAGMGDRRTRRVLRERLHGLRTSGRDVRANDHRVHRAHATACSASTGGVCRPHAIRTATSRTAMVRCSWTTSRARAVRHRSGSSSSGRAAPRSRFASITWRGRDSAFPFSDARRAWADSVAAQHAAGAPADAGLARCDLGRLLRGLSAMATGWIAPLRLLERPPVAGTAARASERIDRATLAAQRGVDERATPGRLRGVLAARPGQPVRGSLRPLSREQRTRLETHAWCAAHVHRRAC